MDQPRRRGRNHLSVPTIPLSEDGRRDQDAGPGGLVTAIAPDVTDGTEPGQPPDGPGTPGRADRPGWLGGLGRRLGGLGRRLGEP